MSSNLKDNGLRNKIDMKVVIELVRYERFGCCALNRLTGEIDYYINKIYKTFTGAYFKDRNTFFALYPTESGPKIFYNNKEYQIHKGLSINIKRKNKNRKFILKDYNIEIDYLESEFLGVDEWSEEIDVDLFYRLEQIYLDDSFYERYTLTKFHLENTKKREIQSKEKELIKRYYGMIRFNTKILSILNLYAEGKCVGTDDTWCEFFSSEIGDFKNAGVTYYFKHPLVAEDVEFSVDYKTFYKYLEEEVDAYLNENKTEGEKVKYLLDEIRSRYLNE